MDSIRPRAARGASEALGAKKMRPCERCGATISVEARVCPECGAPLVPGAHTEVPEGVHADLARANLLRMRGEYREAEAACLSVLRRYPNSAPAHTLLGDIADDAGNLEEAERWYELALDLDADSAGDRRKLEDVRERRRRVDNDVTVEQIGLPKGRPLPWFAIGSAAIAVIAVGAAMYASLHRIESVAPAAVTVRAPLQAPAEAVATPKIDPKPSATERPEPTSTPEPGSNPSAAPAPVIVLDDEATLRFLSQRSPVGSGLISAQLDPRAKIMTLTYALRANEDPRRTAAELARTALESYLEIQVVTLRAVRDGRLAYLGDAPRTRYADTLLAAWQAENASTPDAFTNYVLANEWTPPAANPSP